MRPLAAVIVFAALIAAADRALAAKNVILMVSDGAGYNTWAAADMYLGRVGRQVYDRRGWTTVACTTYPLNMSTAPTGDEKQDPSLLYDPLKVWDKKPVPLLGGFQGYRYIGTHYTDSAAAATAMMTGIKTFNNSLNWSNEDRSLAGHLFIEDARRRGMRCGVITTVEWSHATPAGLGGAHNVSRNAYAEIANEMLRGELLDVMMGAGNPDYNDDGELLSARIRGQAADFVGGPKTWQQLVAGTHPVGWKLYQTKADIEALCHGPTPDKVVATLQVATTLQENRSRGAAPSAGTAQRAIAPFDDPLNTHVPDLATLSRAAIHCLDDGQNGFYLMIEGGAVDWANHANEPARMVEEQVDFVHAVEAVCDWVETHGGWGETLVILTADHECGNLWGPDSDRVPFQTPVDKGQGKLPGLKYHSHMHTMGLVPIFARGPGSERFARFVHGNDPQAAKVYGIRGDFVDNTDIYRVIAAEIAAGKDAPRAAAPAFASPGR